MPIQQSESYELLNLGNLLTDYGKFYNDLGDDVYHTKENGGRTRRLAQHYMTCNSTGEDIKISRLKTQPFLQGKEYNKLTGHIERPIEDHLPETDMKPYIKHGFRSVLERWPNEKSQGEWLVNCHLIRTHAFERVSGEPAPEGIHRDGADFVIMGCVDLNHISGAISNLYADGNKRDPIYSHQLQPGEALMVDDRQVMHAVSPVVSEGSPAYRDMIITGFHYWERDNYHADWRTNIHDLVAPEHSI